MKVNAKASQPTPDEVLNDWFKTRDPSEFFVNGDVSCLTDDGKAVFAIGIQVFKQFNKLKNK